MTDINTLINESIKAAVAETISDQLDTNNKLICMIEAMQKYNRACERQIAALKDTIELIANQMLDLSTNTDRREVCFDSTQFEQAVRKVIRNCMDS